MAIYNIPSLSPCRVNSWNPLSALSSWTQNCLFLRFRRLSGKTRESWLMANFEYGNFRPRAMIALHAGKTICYNSFQTVFSTVLEMDRTGEKRKRYATAWNVSAYSLSESSNREILLSSGVFERKTRVWFFSLWICIWPRNTLVYRNLNFYISCTFPKERNGKAIHFIKTDKNITKLFCWIYIFKKLCLFLYLGAYSIYGNNGACNNCLLYPCYTTWNTQTKGTSL